MSSGNLAEFVLNRSKGRKEDLISARWGKAKRLHSSDLRGHFGCVNALAFSKELLASGGDDRRVLLWKAQSLLDKNGPADKGKLKQHYVLETKHHSNIFSLAFGDDGKKLLSGGGDEIVILHDLVTGKSLDAFNHTGAVYGLDFKPDQSDRIFITAGADGRVLIYDIRLDSNQSICELADYSNKPFHSAVFNPAEPWLIATANQKQGVELYDFRRPKYPLYEYGNLGTSKLYITRKPLTAMSVAFNEAGTKLLALRRRHPAVLFNVESPVTKVEFDNPGYYNSCTMKSGCFAGQNDEYVVSGSDDFNVYIWKIPEEMPGENDPTSGIRNKPPESPIMVDQASMILKGHESIVNQVRYEKNLDLLATGGVEKVVKLWSSFPIQEPVTIQDVHDNLFEEPSAERREKERREFLGRKIFSRNQYIRLIMESGAIMSQDNPNESLEENPRMMAFFDSLIQRDIASSSSSSSSDSSSSSEVDSDEYKEHPPYDSSDPYCRVKRLDRGLRKRKRRRRKSSSSDSDPATAEQERMEKLNKIIERKRNKLAKRRKKTRRVYPEVLQDAYDSAFYQCLRLRLAGRLTFIKPIPFEAPRLKPLNLPPSVLYAGVPELLRTTPPPLNTDEVLTELNDTASVHASESEAEEDVNLIFSGNKAEKEKKCDKKDINKSQETEDKNSDSDGEEKAKIAENLKKLREKQQSDSENILNSSLDDKDINNEEGEGGTSSSAPENGDSRSSSGFKKSKNGDKIKNRNYRRKE